MWNIPLQNKNIMCSIVFIHPNPQMNHWDEGQTLHFNYQAMIEIKDYPQLRLEQIRKGEKGKSGKTIVREIQESLKLKFRDTFLYRYGEGCNKKIVYVCLTNFNNKEREDFCRQLKKEVPASTKGPRWSNELVASERCFVVDIHAWKRNFESKFGTCKKIQ